MANTTSPPRTLQRLEYVENHKFFPPEKRIQDGDDVSFFLASKAYSDIMTFIFQLNIAMLPRKIQNGAGLYSVKEWTLKDPDVPLPPVAENLAKLIEALAAIIDEVPPDTGPRRFGNVSFRKWVSIVRERQGSLMDQYLPADVLALGVKDTEVLARVELDAYLIGSFGSSERLDYGTGHELSFLAFLGCLWKLGAFPESENGEQERAIVLGVIEPYLNLIRRLILTYTLEPAGSHGVWGLDDHSFVPYIFGSAQLSPAIRSSSEIAMEGSLDTAPKPGDIAKANVVERERQRNMYFSAIGFINDVKKGPFWEHSPILYDISGIKAGWAKINKGMLKMYNAEVLGKFPVIQHFSFGSLFPWEKDPAAAAVAASVHTASQPSRTPPQTTRQPTLRDPMADTRQATRAPWGATPGTQMPPLGSVTSRVPAGVPLVPVPSGPNQPTPAPWVSRTPFPPLAGGAPTTPRAVSEGSDDGTTAVPTTRAPWADKRS